MKFKTTDDVTIKAINEGQNNLIYSYFVNEPPTSKIVRTIIVCNPKSKHDMTIYIGREGSVVTTSGSDPTS